MWWFTVVKLINPSLPRTVKFPGWKLDTHACYQYMLQSHNKSNFNIAHFHEDPFTCKREKENEWRFHILHLTLWQWKDEYNCGSFSVCLCLCLSVSLSLSVCLSVCLSLSPHTQQKDMLVSNWILTSCQPQRTKWMCTRMKLQKGESNNLTYQLTNGKKEKKKEEGILSSRSGMCCSEMTYVYIMQFVLSFAARTSVSV